MAQTDASIFPMEFWKKIQIPKNLTPIFFISDQYIVTQIGNTRLSPNEPMFQ